MYFVTRRGIGVVFCYKNKNELKRKAQVKLYFVSQILIWC